MDKKLQNRIAHIIAQSPISNDLDHANATLKWLLYLKPNADISLQIAAFGHDIDRGINKITEKDRPGDIPYDQFKQMHANRSATILSSMLTENNFDESIIKKITNLVRTHEVGGDKESDLLKDADSIAYFELNIPIYLKRNGKEKTRQKIRFMYKRASKRAQDIIKNMTLEDREAQKIANEEI